MQIEKSIDGLILGSLLILIGALFSRVFASIIDSFLRNSTGAYDTAIAASVGPQLQPLILSCAIIGGIVIIAVSIRHAAKTK